MMIRSLGAPLAALFAVAACGCDAFTRVLVEVSAPSLSADAQLMRDVELSVRVDDGAPIVARSSRLGTLVVVVAASAGDVSVSARATDLQDVQWSGSAFGAAIAHHDARMPLLLVREDATSSQPSAPSPSESPQPSAAPSPSPSAALWNLVQERPSVAAFNAVWGFGDEVIAVGTDCAISIGSADGTTWRDSSDVCESFPELAQRNNNLLAISGRDLTQIQIVGDLDSHTLATQDGGTTWTSLLQGFSPDAWSDISIGAGFGCAVQNHGVVFGVRQWSPGGAYPYDLNGQVVPGAFHGVWCGDGSDIYSVGSAGAIVRTPVNAGYLGMGARALASGTTVDLRALWGFGATLRWAVGAQGTVLRSTDAGESWSPVPAGTIADLYDVWGPSADELFVVGADGTILHSTDGGLHFVAEPSGTTRVLRGIWGDGTGRVYVVGSAGTVLRRAH